MPTLSSRRRPWPWDMRLAFSQQPVSAGHIGDYHGKTIGSLRPMLISQLRGASIPLGGQFPFMLVPQEATGLMVGKKQTPLGNMYPPNADYGSAPVYKEHTFEFRPTGGMGESVQSSKTDRRYHYAMNCWVTGGLFGKGPLVHPIVPTNNGGAIRRFIEGFDNTAGLSLFILGGTNVLRRGDDTAGGQVVSRQRAGRTATDAARFTGAYASPVDGLYVAWDDGLLEEYNGAAWVACALPAGFKPQYLCVVGNELWAADGVACQIRKCENDPKVAGSWSGPIFIGTPSVAITAIRQTSNRLCIFKADGDVFTINADGSDNDMFPGLENTIDLTNGRTAMPWLGSLWFRAGRAFFQLDVQSGMVLTPVGPGRQLGNLSEVRGPVQAFAGWNSQLAFGVIYNQGLNKSYLLTYGNWEPQTGDRGTDYTFVTQWDGAIASWSGRRATALWVSAIPSESRLYVGFADGGYDWIKLVPYPLLPGSGAEFTIGESYIVAPIHHDMFEADNKQWIGASCFGPYFGTDSMVSVKYRLRASAGMPPSDPAGQFLSGTNPFTFNGQRWDFRPPIASVALEMQVLLSSSSSASTPILEGIGLHQRLVPAFRRDYAFTIDARDNVARRDGATTRQSGRKTRDVMLQAAAAPATISIELPDENIVNVAVFDYTERMVAHSAQGGQGWGCDVQVTEFVTLTLYGTVGRTRGTSIGHTRGWKISDLRYF